MKRKTIRTKNMLLFILIMFLSMFGGRAFAHNISVANSNGKTIYYNWINNKTALSVTYRGDDCGDYDEYSGSIVIPASVTYSGSTYPVKEINYDAFNGCTSLTSVTIPNSVTTIGIDAFNGCTSLTSVTIPNSVTIIGADAFQNSKWYNNQPNGMVYAGNVAYKYKGTMPSNTEISLLEGTLGIAEMAFSNCVNLTSINIPNSVSTICASAFYKCTGLSSITLPNSLTIIERETFWSCSNLSSVNIPSSVTKIAYWAFSGCSSLTSVTIPSSVTSIEKGAFNECTSLTEVTVEGVTPVSITYPETFSNRANATLYVPFGSKTDYVAADYWNEFNEIVEYGEKDLSSSDISIAPISAVTYNGSEQTPAITVKDGNTTLTSGTNYTVSYSNNINAGTATVSITGLGNYTGMKTTTFTINPQNASELDILVSSEIIGDDLIYNGSAQTPPITVKDGNTRLTNGTDYTISYSNNINAGTATVTITGSGNYTGTKSDTFTILPKNISEWTICDIDPVTYNGLPQTPPVTVNDGSATMVEGTDYTIQYTYNIYAGEGNAQITGKGNYTGTRGKYFTINPKSVASLTISYSINLDYLDITTYSSDGIIKANSNDNNIDINVKYLAYADNTCTHIMNCLRVLSPSGVSYVIDSSNLFSHEVFGTFCLSMNGYTYIDLQAIEEGNWHLRLVQLYAGDWYYYYKDNFVYDGSTLLPTITVKDGSTILSSEYDYTASYSNNINESTVTVTIRGKGNYTGAKATTFAIPKSVSNLTISPIDNVTYNGSAQTPTITVKDGSTTLTSGTDYTVSYSNNTNAGTAAVTVTGKGNYMGTKTANFSINAKNASNLTISSISAVTYNGLAQTPAVTVKDGSTTLTSETDYTVSYSDNTNAGTATVTVTGKGNYTGMKTANFIITKASLTITAKSYTITQDDPFPAFEAEYSGFMNSETSDVLTTQPTFSCSATSTSNPGTYDINVSGADAKNYSFEYVNGTLTIIKDVSVPTDISCYSNSGIVKVFSNTPNIDIGVKYLAYKENSCSEIMCCLIAQSPSGEEIILDSRDLYDPNRLGNWCVSKNGYTFIDLQGKEEGMWHLKLVQSNAGDWYYVSEESGKDINNSDISINPIAAVTYNGLAQTPAVTVKDGSTTLTSETDYTVSYSDNTNAGTATVTVTGKGNYTGMKTANFIITKASLTITAKSYTIAQDDPFPAFEAEYSGFMNSETSDVLTTQPTFSCSATSTSNPGTYPIIVSGGAATNYDFTYVNGALTINGASNIINFADANVKALCVDNWDKNGDGELSEAEATAVTTLGKVFSNKSTITSFNELQYFSGLSSIGDEAFIDCSNLISITIPSSVTSIGYKAFYGCSGLTSVTIPNSVTSIGEYAFWSCSGLTSVTISNSVTSIEESVFSRCTGLTSVKIPESVTSIGSNVFYSCSGLTSVTIGNSVTFIGHGAFYCCTGLTSIKIPESVTSIDYSAFEGCSSLTSIKIPEKVTSIGHHAFSYCSKLTKVKVENMTPVSITSTTFPNSSNATLYVPRDSWDSYSFANNWKEFGTIKEYPDGDVNEDGEIDVVDVVDIARFVVGTPADSFVEFLADLDENGSVNVADAIVLANEIAGDTNFARTRFASAPIQTDNILSLCSDGSSLSLEMEGDERFAAFQFDLRMPSDMDIMQLSLNNERRQGHQLLYNKLGDGHYRVVALSTSGNAFNGTTGELLGITLDNYANDEVYLDNIHFVTTDGVDVPYEPIRVSYATIIRSPEKTIYDDQPIYNLNGQRLYSPQKGLNIIGGKKIVVK